MSYQPKATNAYVELGMGFPKGGGDGDISSEGLNHSKVETIGKNKSRPFPGEEDRIRLRQEVTVSRH